MKVVILHQHFNTPEGGGPIRSWYLAKALTEKGIQVAVITAHNDSIYREAVVDGIEVHYLPVPYDNSFGFAARGISFLKFTAKSVRLAARFTDANVIYAISVPLTVGIAAMRIKNKFKIPYLFEVGDLWPDAPVELGFVKNFFLRSYLFGLEKRIYRQAKSVIALSPAIQQAIEKKVPGKVTHMIPNMADCDFYQPQPKNPEFERHFGTQGKFVVSYIGAAGYANGLDYFLECANTCRKQQMPVHFVMCGEGAFKRRMQGLADRLGLKNLSFMDLQNREGVKRLMNVTDAMFVCYKNVPILETGSPNKFFDGLAAGKLIIVNFGGWIRKEIEENECGIYADPQRPTEFANKIRVFLDDDIRLEKFQKAARALAERKYSRKILSEQFVRIFE